MKKGSQMAALFCDSGCKFKNCLHNAEAQEIAFQRTLPAYRRANRISEPLLRDLCYCKNLVLSVSRIGRFSRNDGRDPCRRLHRLRYLFAPDSNPGRIPAGRHAVQKVRLSAARSPSKLPEFPEPELN